MLTEVITLFWPWGVLFSLFVALFTATVRVLVEGAWRGAEKSVWWTELGLLGLPLLLGGIMALLLTDYPFPAMVTARSTRLVWGSVLGGFSGFTYRAVKAILNREALAAQLAVKVDEEKKP